MFAMVGMKPTLRAVTIVHVHDHCDFCASVDHRRFFHRFIPELRRAKLTETLLQTLVITYPLTEIIGQMRVGFFYGVVIPCPVLGLMLPHPRFVIPNLDDDQNVIDSRAQNSVTGVLELQR